MSSKTWHHQEEEIITHHRQRNRSIPQDQPLAPLNHLSGAAKMDDAAQLLQNAVAKVPEEVV